MTRGFKRFLAVVAMGGLAVAVGAVVMAPGQGQRKGAGGRAADAPVPVLAANASRADVPVYLDGVGTTRALNIVTVRPLVDGTLINVAFREGQDVKKGDVLAQVDPVTYQAQLDQALAKKALDEAQLANARVDLERYANLVKTNAITKQQVDTQRAQVAQLEAQVRLDQGAIDNARAYLNWCTITSPLDGRTGIRQVDQGNIVHAADATGIVVITQIKPIAMLFTLPQQQIGQVNSAFAKGPLSVEALGSDNRTIVDRGTLQVVNNQVDQTTGTIQLKAEFPNQNLQLWPGQFVNVKLLVDTLRDVVVVPTAAVQRGPNGAFVYVVQPDDTVSVQLVKVGQQNENQAVISEGLQGHESIVTTGFTQLADKRKVKVASADGSPSPPATGEQKGGSRKGGRTSEAAPEKSQ